MTSNPEIITRHLPNGDWAVSVWSHGVMIAFDFGPFSSHSEAYLAAYEWLATPEAVELLQESEDVQDDH